MFDIVIRLIMSLAFVWMGLNLFLGPRDYKAFAENLKGPSINRIFVRFPDWAIRVIGALLILVGIGFFARLVATWHPR
jgi:uncharacterized membrane protein YphA (DoxX/SURF4 family)